MNWVMSVWWHWHCCNRSSLRTCASMVAMLTTFMFTPFQLPSSWGCTVLAISLSQQMWYSFPFRFSFVQSMPHSGSNSRLWIQQVCAFTYWLLAALKSTSKLAHLRPPSIPVIMADWMNQMAIAVDEAEAANARAQNEVPTEPALTPRSQHQDIPGSPRWVEELQLPSLEYAPRPEPERFAIRFVLNDGFLPQEEYEELARKAAQAFNNRDMERERRQAEAAEHEAHERSIREWETQIQARGLDAPSLPSGPTPQGTSSQRELPRVHEVLHQSDPRGLSYSQPAVKKAPPTSGRPMPSLFHSETEPPRIGSGSQPPPPAAPRPKGVPSIALPLAETPMTPGHPPRPPLSALPKHSSMETSSCANKHALDPPTAQAPPSKQVRCKAFPGSSQPPDQVYVAASASVEMSQPCRPCPKGPPATFLPTPPEIASMKTDSYEEDRKARLNEEGMYLRVKYPSEIDWTSPLWEQLAPVLKGGPSPNTCRALQGSTRESLSSRQCHHSDEESCSAQDPYVRTCSMGTQCDTLVQSIGSADDDCHMVS